MGKADVGTVTSELNDLLREVNIGPVTAYNFPADVSASLRYKVNKRLVAGPGGVWGIQLLQNEKLFASSVISKIV